MQEHRTEPAERRLKFQLMADRAWMERIEDWMWCNRIRSKASAIRKLVEAGLEASKNAEKAS